MPEQPKLNAYVVSLTFAEAMTANVIIATKPEAASAILVSQVVREHPEFGELTGALVVPVAEAWLHSAIRAVEHGVKPAEVVSLVPKDTTAEAQPVWRTDASCTAHNIVGCVECLLKEKPPFGLYSGRLVPRDPA